MIEIAPNGFGADPADREDGPGDLIRVKARDTAAAEAAFVDSLAAARDPARFLARAGVPLTARCGDGKTLTLLHVETGLTIEIGHLSASADDGAHAYAALPAGAVARRRALRLVYHDGIRLIPLTLGEARALAEDQLAEDAEDALAD